jgi:hypothetical protein
LFNPKKRSRSAPSSPPLYSCFHPPPPNRSIQTYYSPCKFQVASTLFLSRSIIHIFENWLNGIDHRFKKHIRVGAIVFTWSLWLYRNDKVFNGKNSSILQVIYRGISTLGLWSSLQRVEDRDLFMEGYFFST